MLDPAQTGSNPEAAVEQVTSSWIHAGLCDQASTLSQPLSAFMRWGCRDNPRISGGLVQVKYHGQLLKMWNQLWLLFLSYPEGHVEETAQALAPASRSWVNDISRKPHWCLRSDWEVVCITLLSSHRPKEVMWSAKPMRGKNSAFPQKGGGGFRMSSERGQSQPGRMQAPQRWAVRPRSHPGTKSDTRDVGHQSLFSF